MDSLATDASSIAAGGKDKKLDNGKSEKKGILSYLGLDDPKKNKDKLATAAATADNFKDFGFVKNELSELNMVVDGADRNEQVVESTVAEGGADNSNYPLHFKKSAPIRKGSV